MPKRKLIWQLRRQLFRELPASEKVVVIGHRLLSLLTRVIGELLPIVFLAVAFAWGVHVISNASNDPLPIVWGSHFLLVLLLTRFTHNRWDLKNAQSTDPVVADLAALPMSDRIIFRRLFRRRIRVLAFGFVMLMISWLMIGIESPHPIDWRLAISLAGLQVAFSYGCGIHASLIESQRRVGRILLMVTPLTGCVLSVLISGSETTWLLWLGVAGYSIAVAGVLWSAFLRLQNAFGIHEFFFENGNAAYFITPSTHALWQHYLHCIELENPTGVEPEPLVVETDTELTGALAREFRTHRFSQQTGRLWSLIHRMLSQRELTASSIIWSDSGRWADTSLRLILVWMIATVVIVTTPLTPFLVGVIVILWLAIWPWFTISFNLNQCLEFPFSFKEIVWSQSKLFWLRLTVRSPLLIASGIAIGHLSETEIQFSLAVTLKLLIAIAILIPTVVSITVVAGLKTKWLRWFSVQFFLAFLGAVVIETIGVWLLFADRTVLNQNIPQPVYWIASVVLQSLAAVLCWAACEKTFAVGSLHVTVDD